MAIAHWDADGVLRQAHGELERRLDAAAIRLAGAVKRKLSVPGTGLGRDARGRHARVSGVRHAPEGEPPYKQTGRLRASIAWERSGRLSRRVGSNVEYARNQELGITVRPHPYLRPSLAEQADTLRRIIQR